MTIPERDAEALRSITATVLEKRPRELCVTEDGLMFVPPGEAVIRAMVWAVYDRSEDLFLPTGAATFPSIDFPAVAERFPNGAHASQVRAYVEWFEALRLNIPVRED